MLGVTVRWGRVQERGGEGAEGAGLSRVVPGEQRRAVLEAERGEEAADTPGRVSVACVTGAEEQLWRASAC